MVQCRERWIWSPGFERLSAHIDNQCSLGPSARLGRSCFSVQEAKRRTDFRNVSWGLGFYRRIGCQTLNYWKTKIFTLLNFFNLCPAPSVPVLFRGDVGFPTLQALPPFCLSMLLCRWQYLHGRGGNLDKPSGARHQKKTPQVVKPQPVFLLKPVLSSCFSKGGIKAQRAGVFPPRDHATMAGKPGVFAQAGSNSGSQGHPDLLLAAHEQKGAGGLRKKQLRPGGNTAKKKQDPHTHFFFTSPKASPMSGLPPQPVRAYSTPSQTLLPSGDASLLQETEERVPGNQEPMVCMGSHEKWLLHTPQWPLRNLKPWTSTVTVGLGKYHFPHSWSMKPPCNLGCQVWDDWFLSDL